MATPVRVTAKQLLKDLYKRPAIKSSNKDITVFNHINSMIDFIFGAYCANCAKNPLPLNNLAKNVLFNSAHIRIFWFVTELLDKISTYSGSFKSIENDKDKIFEFQDHFAYEYQLKSLYVNIFDRLNGFYTDISHGLYKDGTPTSTGYDIVNCFIYRLIDVLKL